MKKNTFHSLKVNELLHYFKGPPFNVVSEGTYTFYMCEIANKIYVC
jgi:hypothetical protein